MNAKSERNWGPRTMALHEGYSHSNENPSLEVPFVDSVAFGFFSTQHAADLFEGIQEGFVYGRINNPTVDAFERRMAELERAEAGLGTSSGMAATLMVVSHLAQKGHIVSSDRVYGGTFNLLSNTLVNFGIHTSFVKDPHDIRSWESEITKKTKLLFVETPSNPKAEVFNIRVLAQLAHEHGLPLVVDSTIATPVLQKPILLGADVVVHSATKYICGDGTALGGVIVGEKELMNEIRGGIYRDFGATLSPFHAWYYLKSIGTLWARMDEHCNNAILVAEFLEDHPKVKAVYYPGLKSSPHFKLVGEQMGGRASSLMAFEIDGTRESGACFIESLELVKHAAHLGYNKTLAIHPATTTHSQLPTEALERIGISDTMIRMSIGREDPQDIINDINQALDRTTGKLHD